MMRDGRTIWNPVGVLFVIVASVAAQEPQSANPKTTAEPPTTESARDDAKPADAKPVTTGRDIVRRADAAAKAIKLVKYHVRNQRLDVPESQAGISEGTVIMTGWTGTEPERFRFDMASRIDAAATPVRVAVGTDRKKFWAINYRDKTAQVGDDITALGFYRLAVRYFAVYEFVLERPFGDEIEANTVELRGRMDVDGEPCYVIRVVYAAQQQEAVWYFSQKDYLPRRVDRRLYDPQGATVTRASYISNIEIDPKLEEDPFAFKPPEGFTVVEKSGE